MTADDESDDDDESSEELLAQESISPKANAKIIGKKRSFNRALSYVNTGLEGFTEVSSPTTAFLVFRVGF